MTPLVQYCSGAVKALTAQYEMTQVLAHSATAGAARERLIQDLLIAHIPEMTSVVSGMIVDSSGQRSKQQDIVLMLKSMPRLPFASGHDLIFQEGAVATFEIKTEITPNVLVDITANIESVRLLKASTLEATCFGELRWPYERILSAVITYKGSALDTIAEALARYPASKQPDIYLDLSRGILIRNEGLLVDKNGTDLYLVFNRPEVGLARLLTLLSIVTSRVVTRSVNWDAYLS